MSLSETLNKMLFREGWLKNESEEVKDVQKDQQDENENTLSSQAKFDQEKLDLDEQLSEEEIIKGIQTIIDQRVNSKDKLLYRDESFPLPCFKGDGVKNCQLRKDPPVSPLPPFLQNDQSTNQSSSEKCLVLIQLDDEVKIIISSKDVEIYEEVKRLYGTKNEDISYEDFLLNLNQIFYPDLAAENITILDINIDQRLIKKLTNNEGLLLERYTRDLDKFREKILQLSELDGYFSLTSLICSPNKEQLTRSLVNNSVNLSVNNVQPNNKTLLIQEIPYENFLPVGEETVNNGYSNIESAKIYFFYNNHTFRGHIFKNQSELPFDLQLKDETTIRQIFSEFCPELDLVKIISIDEVVLFETYGSLQNRFNQIFTNKENFLQQIEQLEQSLKTSEVNAFTTPDCSEIKQYILDHYQLSKNLEKRMKFTDLYDQIRYNMQIHADHQKFVKTVLPQILKELKLEKKRYSDGMYWYGIKVNLEQDNSKNGHVLENPKLFNNSTKIDSTSHNKIVDRFETLKSVYAKKEGNVEQNEVNIPTVVKPRPNKNTDSRSNTSKIKRLKFQNFSQKPVVQTNST